MKAIMISVRSKWVCKIVDDKTKKDEIRKGSSLYKAINRLIEEQGVAPMLIYCTKEYQGSRHAPTYYLNGKVVARFNATADLLELKMIEGGLFFAKPDKEVIELDLNENAQIDNFELLRYTGYKLGTQISDIHINNLVIFEEPKEISEFYKSNTTMEYIKSCWENYGMPDKDDYDEVKLTRAPQSWCYIEV